MARYIKKHTRVGSMGPTEERGFAIWTGYDIVGIDEDLTSLGLVKIDDWSEAQIAAHGIKSFARIDPDDHPTYAALGIRRK
jgi:hypothetical protein